MICDDTNHLLDRIWVIFSHCTTNKNETNDKQTKLTYLLDEESTVHNQNNQTAAIIIISPSPSSSNDNKHWQIQFLKFRNFIERSRSAVDQQSQVSRGPNQKNSIEALIIEHFEHFEHKNDDLTLDSWLTQDNKQHHWTSSTVILNQVNHQT